MELNVLKIVNKHRRERGSLVPILEDIQKLYGTLPEKALKLVATSTRRPLIDVYGVATFYKNFRVGDAAKHTVTVCTGTSCHVRGSDAVRRAFVRELRLDERGRSRDGDFTLRSTNCFGICSHGPTCRVDDTPYRLLDEMDVPSIVAETRHGSVARAKTQYPFDVSVRCPLCSASIMDEEYRIEDHPSIRLTMAFEQKRGWIRFSSIYSSHRIELEYPVHANSIVHFLCPHCDGELTSENRCFECESPLVPLRVEGGGVLHFCSRRGCSVHLLDFQESFFS